MESYWLYVLVAVTLILTPGADTVLVTRNTLALGSKSGRTTALGTATGIFVHTCAVIIGISAILAASSVIYETIKWIGAAYLVYLGVKSFITGFTAQKEIAVTKKSQVVSTKSCYLQGVLTNVLNPKITVFFLTFLPQFVTPGDQTVQQFLLLGMTYIVLLVIWLFLYVFLLDLFKVWFEKPSTGRFFDFMTGSVMILLGLKLALEKE
ncbi:LysE family translocator [Pseudalkalibacillus caeni]|nr:LysE family translocator [Pseudalkalibacillus caeni]